MKPVRILFVCLGNICRSPLAEGILRHLADTSGKGDAFHIDSAGTGGGISARGPTADRLRWPIVMASIFQDNDAAGYRRPISGIST